MNASAVIIPAATLGMWLTFPAPAGAHRLDEYLQTTRVAIDIDRVGLDIDLTPGASMAAQVVEWIDTDRDGEISAAEGHAYARQMIGSVALSIDDRPEHVTLVEHRFPAIRDMLLGEGTIRLRATARLSAAALGRHRVSYLNSHRPETSVYLVNALVPENPRIRIARQQRDQAQHGIAVDYSVGLSIQGWLLAGFAMVAALVVMRRSDMPRILCRRAIGLLSIVVLASSAIAAQAPDTSVHAVAYVDVMPASRAAGVAALKQYRDASRKDDGFVRVESFEQIGRPGHFAVLETWRDQKAADAHGMAAHTQQLQSALQPVRSSGYDQRPYKTVTVGPAAAAAAGQTIYVITHVDVVPNPQNDPPGLLRRLAEASRAEKGNVRFDVLQHMMRANHFTIVEAWQGQSALDAHAIAPHTRQYRDTLQPMSGGPLDERLYKVVE